MNVRQLMRRARDLYNSDSAPPEVNRAYRKKWVRMILWLGDRWLLANKVKREVR